MDSVIENETPIDRKQFTHKTMIILEEWKNENNSSEKTTLSQPDEIIQDKELYNFHYKTYNTDNYPKEKSGWRWIVPRYSTVIILKQCREFFGWNEDLYYSSIKFKDDPEDLDDEDFVFIDENYKVTKHGISNMAEIFNGITPEWKDYCDNILKLGKFH